MVWMIRKTNHSPINSCGTILFMSKAARYGRWVTWMCEMNGRCDSLSSIVSAFIEGLFPATRRPLFADLTNHFGYKIFHIFYWQHIFFWWFNVLLHPFYSEKDLILNWLIRRLEDKRYFRRLKIFWIQSITSYLISIVHIWPYRFNNNQKKLPPLNRVIITRYMRTLIAPDVGAVRRANGTADRKANEIVPRSSTKVESKLT